MNIEQIANGEQKLSIRQKLNALIVKANSAHESDTTNPHGVTKAQVGLSNVDNTSDADKPVSTSQQTALNGKASISHDHLEDPVLDETARLALDTPAGTYVEQQDKENVIFFQTGADASDPDSWIALPYNLVVDPPATASSTGSPNQIAYDNNYFYVCVAANTWLRAPLATW